MEAARAKQPIPRDIIATTPSSDREALEVSRNQIEQIITKEGNSVWAWYIANISAPVRLTERKVDRIVANPPWVTMAEIQVKERKATLEAFSKRMGLWDGGKQAPHHDIAQLFVKRCREPYLANPDSDPAAWLVKKAALTGGIGPNLDSGTKKLGHRPSTLKRSGRSEEAIRAAVARYSIGVGAGTSGPAILRASLPNQAASYKLR